MIRLEKNDAKMIRWTCYVRCEDRVSPKKPRACWFIVILNGDAVCLAIVFRPNKIY